MNEYSDRTEQITESFLSSLSDLLNTVPNQRLDLALQDAPAVTPTEFISAAVLVPLVVTVTGIDIVLTRRTQHLKAHPGQISFPGGRIEPDDESPAHAALRETREELGVETDHIELFGALDALDTTTGYFVYPVVGRMPAELTYAPDSSEVSEVLQIPLDYVLDRNHHQQQRRVISGRMREFYVIQYRQYEIWGATARMLVNFAEKLENSEAFCRLLNRR